MAPRASLPAPRLLADLAGWAWRLLLLAALGWLALRIVERFALVFVPFAAALLLTALLSPLTRMWRRLGIPRFVATALTALLGLAALGGILTWVVSEAVGQAPQLVAELTDTVQRLPVGSNTLARWRDQALQELAAHQGQLTQSALTGLTIGAEALTGLLLTALFTLIFLTDGDRMWAWVTGRLPQEARARVQEAGGHAYGRLSGWIRGTVLIATFHGSVTALTLLVLHVPLIAPLAILVFFGSFIPIVGAVIFGGVAVLVAFASGGVGPAIALIAILLIDNQIEAHVLQPFLVGRYVHLHPFVIAVVITAGAVLEGLVGTLLAVPFTAACYAALQHLGPVDPPPPRPRPTAPRFVRRGGRMRP